MLSEAEIINRLTLHENIRLKPYYCTAGKQTIGIGRNLDDNPLTAEEKRVCGDWEHGITKAMAYYLCRNDIAKFTKDCKVNIPFFDNLDSERQYALIDMCFNLGIKGLLGFKKMLGALAVGNWERAAEECLDSDYARQTGERAKRISEVFRCGIFKRWV